MDTPRLRSVNKIAPPYPVGQFPAGFVSGIAREVVCHLAFDAKPSIEGEEWERIFASSIGAQWKPSNVGLDDVVMGNCAWGAKTVKNGDPLSIHRVRLISGRNSPNYSFNNADLGGIAQVLGDDVLAIWNARVEDIRARFPHMRTVVLVKSNDLTTFCVFEFETVRYPPDLYVWARNINGNLEGRHQDTGVHTFTWQPHGSQFTIIEPVPSSRVLFSVRPPQSLKRADILKAVGFDNSWVTLHPVE
jgi:hypothetical protein